MPRQYTPRVHLICVRCDRHFTETPSRVGEGRGKFCSSECRLPGAPEDRFWAKVNREGPILRPEIGACWLWTGGKYSNGYGTARINGRQTGAHVVAYILTTGHEPPPESPCVLHHCDGGAIGCVRPSHLYAGTKAQNVRDAIERNRISRGEAHAATIRGHGIGSRHRSRTHPESVARGARQWMAVFTDDLIREIRLRYAQGGITQRELAAEHGVARQTISKIVSGSAWAHVA